MSHNQRFASDSFYVNGYAIPSEYFQAIDTAQSQGLNADAGGAVAPTQVIIIGGAGLYMESTLTLNGGQVMTLPGSGKRVTLADSVPLCSVGHTVVTSFGRARDLRAPIREQYYFIGSQGVSGLWSATTNVFAGQVFSTSTSAFVLCTVSGQTGGSAPSWPTTIGTVVQDHTVTWVTVDATVASQSIAKYNSTLDGMQSARPGMHLLLPLAVHDGASFSEAKITFKIINSHGTLPATLPSARIVAVGSDGTVTSMSADAANDAGGWGGPTPPGGGFNAGNWTGVQTIPLFWNGVAPINFNCATTRYYCEFRDEAGIGALGGNVALACEMTMAVNDYRFQ